jgi:cellulose synthase/poly-beta-1,6-N-acetylglucosamine synthase-like glycosyltransferase
MLVAEITTLVSWCLGIAAACFAIPVATFFLEIAASFLAKKNSSGKRSDRGHVAVLIPAHNEASGLLPTLEDVQSQVRKGDRLVVVADNCTDGTAAVAASAGAEVTIRTDPTRIGKGYALDWGLGFLANDPPDIVVIIDADCRVGFDAIDKLANVATETGHPVQSLYLMTAGDQSPVNHQVAEFAWRVKNWVRPLGLKALGLPCQLMGTGMAFPWRIIRSAPLASGQIVEDIKLGLDLALDGHAPVFCPSAVVTSNFANSTKGAETQRQRWEHGHIGLILTAAPRLIVGAINKRNIKLFTLTLDLIVPPLSLLCLIVVAMLIASGITAFIGGSSFALKLNVICLALIAAATIFAWCRFGRDVLPIRSIVLIPGFVAAKLSLYGNVLSGRRVANWIRSDRN